MSTTADDLGNLEYSRLLAAKEEAEAEFLLAPAAQGLDAVDGDKAVSFENIVGVGIRRKLHHGRRTGPPSVAIYVVQKEPMEFVDQAAIVPKAIDGVPTDVIQSGEFVAFAAERSRCRPAPSGVSLGNSMGTTGTLGFFARRDGDLFVVGCNHVLGSNLGDVVLQPSLGDGGQAADTVGELSSWVTLKFGGQYNYVDSAAAIVAEPEHIVTSEIFGVGQIDSQLHLPADDLPVLKYGRTTRLTHGEVTDCSFTARVRHGLRRAYMAEQLVVESTDLEPFSEPGDSGSLVVEEGTFRPVGVVCGGTRDFTVVTPISRVLKELRVEFAHG